MDLRVHNTAEHLLGALRYNDTLNFHQKQRHLTSQKPPQFILNSTDEIRELDLLFGYWDSLCEKDVSRQNYFTTKPNLNGDMRYQVVEWMCDSSCDLGFQRQTFHLAVNYVDQYLTNSGPMMETDMQILAAASLYLASKVEESNPEAVSVMDLSQFEWDNNEDNDNGLPIDVLQDKARDKMTQWEDNLLDILDWNLRMTTSLDWLMMYCQNAALMYPQAFGDPSVAGDRVVHRRFLTNIFRPATRKLDELVANAQTIDLPNSLIAAIVFGYVCGNGNLIPNPIAVCREVTGYDISHNNYADLIKTMHNEEDLKIVDGYDLCKVFDCQIDGIAVREENETEECEIVVMKSEDVRLEI